MEAFLASRRQAGYVMHRSPRALAPLLSHLRAAGAAPPAPAAAPPETPLEELIESYRRYLETERGLTAGSVSGYLGAVRPFLATRIRGEALDLEGLGAAEVSAFVLAECPRRSIGHAKLTVTALRSLLRFLHLDGALEESLDSAVPSVAG